jgi:hypothetical protein
MSRSSDFKGGGGGVEWPHINALYQSVQQIFNLKWIFWPAAEIVRNINFDKQYTFQMKN